MGNEHQDRRVRKTEQQLYQGLTKLLQEKSLNEISVMELTKLTDMNRGTFYLHYKDIFDMVEQIEQRIFDEFLKLFEKYTYPEVITDPLPILADAFNFVAENKDMCSVLLGKNSNISFIEKIKTEVKVRCLSDWAGTYNKGSAKNLEYFSAFIVSGVIGLIQYWFDSGMRDSPQEMAVLTKEMMMVGIKVLQ